MVVQVQKWGNSLAVRIPRAYAADLGIEAGTEVAITLEDGALRLRLARKRPRLEDLVRRIDASNTHAEADHGPRQGNEAW